MGVTNPYLPPISDSQVDTAMDARLGPRWAGVFLSALMGCIYVVVLGAAIYEYFRASSGALTTDYVRTGIASAIFAIVSFSATTCFLLRKPIAQWMFYASPLLLIAFVYPGLNAIWNFVNRMLAV